MQNVVFLSESIHLERINADLLESAGYRVAGHLPLDADEFLKIKTLSPDVIVLITQVLPIELLKEVALIGSDLKIPIMIYTLSDNSTVISYAIEIGISAFVVATFDSNRFGAIATAAVARYTVFEALSNELSKTRQSLRERKIVERAKGLLMKLRSIDESAAHRLLQKKAMEKNRKLVEVAQSVIDAQEYLFDKD